MIEPQSLIEWSDDHIAILNKPADLRSIPDGYDPELPHVRSIMEPLLGRLWIVHRLDRLTSGLLVVARSAAAHRNLNLQFDASLVRKKYHAIVHGMPDWSTRQIDFPLRTDGDRRHRTIVDMERGKQAQTKVMVLSFGQDCALLEVQPTTGRTHQIRAHLSAIGHPVIGDPLYSDNKAANIPTRMALHACQLEFSHPVSSEKCSFKIEDPHDFDNVLAGV